MIMKSTGQYRTIQDMLDYFTGLLEQGKADPMEPVFTLRGQDRLAVPTVFFWAQIAEKHGVDLKKVAGAWAHAEAMAAWPKRKMPD